MLAACWACALQDLSTREGRVCWSLLVSPYRLSPQLNYQQKVGIMYCKAGQSTEEEMYNNESAGPAFEEFLQLLGERVRLKGFEKYRAQLDTKSKKYLPFCYAWLPLPRWRASANSCRKRHCRFLQKAAGEGGERAGRWSARTVRDHHPNGWEGTGMHCCPQGRNTAGAQLHQSGTTAILPPIAEC